MMVVDKDNSENSDINTTLFITNEFLIKEILEHTVNTHSCNTNPPPHKHTHNPPPHPAHRHTHYHHPHTSHSVVNLTLNNRNAEK